MEDFIKKKKLLTPVTNHHYKLDIRKSEIVFNIFLQKLIRANYLIEVKKRINKTNAKFTTNIN